MEILILIIAVIVIAVIFSNKKKSNNKEQKQVLEGIEPIILRNNQIIKESIDIAEKSKKFNTVKSRINLAEKKIAEIEQISIDYPFLEISNFKELQNEVDEITYKILNSWWDKTSKFNQKGIALEKDNEIDKAIEIYEKAVQAETDTPHTYKRLVILYRKQKDYKNEKRVLKIAIKNTGKHWFDERLKKLEEKAE